MAPLVAFAPANTNPVVTAVEAPFGVLTRMGFWRLLQQRLAKMNERAGEQEAEEQIRVLTPDLHWDLIGIPLDRWAQTMIDSDPVQVGLSEALSEAPDFPLKVKGPSRGATNALGTSLEAWLMHVVPREHD